MLPLVALREVTPGPAVDRPPSDRTGHMTEQPTLIFTLCREKGLCGESTLNSRIFSSKSLRFTHFRKNASATPLVSHTCKKVVGGTPVWRRLSPRAGPRFLRAMRDRSVQGVANHNPRITSP